MKRTALPLFAVALAAGCGLDPGDPPKLADLPPIHEAPAAVAVQEPAAAPAVAADPRTVDRMRLAEERVRDLEAEILHLESEVERFRQGLNRCVEKLNETSASAAATYSPPARSSPRRGSPARVSTLSAPRISIVGDSAVVSVRVWNAGDEDASGTVELELVCGGNVVDSSIEHVDVTARTDQTVTAELRTGSAEGSCVGRANLRF